MRIVSLVPENTVPAIYRSLVPMQALAQRGHSVHVEETNDIRETAALREADLVHLMRICHPLLTRFVRRLQQRGVAVVWDNDDERVASVREPTRRAGAGRESISLQRYYAAMKGVTSVADLVTTPSAALADVHADLSGRDVRILPNRLPPTFTRPERVMPHAGVRIGWHAMGTHASAWEELGLREVLEHLLARHAHLSILAIGLDVGIASRRYTHIPFLDYGALPQELAHVDVGLAPLTDTAAEAARSDVKLKEYAAAGVPWLASGIGPYAGLGEQQGGRLVADGDWFEAIDRLVSEADTRRVLAQRGMRWAAGETIESHVQTWERTFEEAVEHARSPAVR
jgi:glycosyltransferase involved in cell wall biosynthesis